MDSEVKLTVVDTSQRSQVQIKPYLKVSSVSADSGQQRI